MEKKLGHLSKQTQTMCKELKLSGKQSTQENKFIFIFFLRQRVKWSIGQEIKKKASCNKLSNNTTIF